MKYFDHNLLAQRGIYDLNEPGRVTPSSGDASLDLSQGWQNIVENSTIQAVIDFLTNFWSVWKVIAILLSILAIIGIIYARSRIIALRKEQKEQLKMKAADARARKTMPANQQWQKITKLAESDSESDWRIAIVEADVMLEDMLRAQGYEQDTLGEILRSIEKADFQNLEKAWEAHKVRNKIAHEGSNFKLTEREVKRVIGLFEDCFREFHYI